MVKRQLIQQKVRLEKMIMINYEDPKDNETSQATIKFLEEEIAELQEQLPTELVMDVQRFKQA